MRRIRVAEVIEATENGTKKHVLQLLRTVDRSRFELELVASNLRDPEGFQRDLDALRAEGFTCHLVPMTREVRPVRDALALLRLVRLFTRRRYDVVHCHSSKAGFLGRLAAFLTGVPWIVYTPHCFSFTAGFGRIVGWFYEMLEFVAGKMTDRLIAVSPHEHEAAVKAGSALPHNVRTIVNGLPDDEFVLRSPGADVRREAGLPEGAPVVGSIGRLGRQKGYDLFIRAAKLVHDARGDVHFLLVGKGPYETMLRRLASDLGLDGCFHFVGARQDIPELLALLDVFVMSSRWEAMPYSLLEAMAAGRAIVVTSVCGLDRVIENGYTGVIVPPENPEAIARAVTSLLDDPSRRGTLGRAARETAGLKYRLAPAVREIERLYREGFHER
jgi:glycosyltransferase involved in cell wall biosynthesis